MFTLVYFLEMTSVDTLHIVSRMEEVILAEVIVLTGSTRHSNSHHNPHGYLARELTGRGHSDIKYYNIYTMIWC